MRRNIVTPEPGTSDEDVPTSAPTFENAGQAISQGKRHLLVRDYGLAVATLAEGVGMLANQYGEMADELAEPYLLYGKALLYLAREEAGVLGAGVPGAEEEDDEEDEAEEDPAEKDKEAVDNEAVDKEADDKEAVDKEADKDKIKPKAEEEKKTPETPAEDKEKAVVKEKKAEEPTVGGGGSSSAGAGPGPSSSSSSTMNGGASTSGLQQNGEAHDNSDDDGEDVEEEDDDANSNLRIAWEVLELAKLILMKRESLGWKLLADTHRLLGEVSMEGGNQPASLIDLNACLDLLQKIEPADPRSLAETHYQLGLAHSLGNEFDASIEQFLKATSLLEERIKALESSTEETAAEEMKELKELLPEIHDKISDMRDFKSQAAKLVIEKIKSMSGGSCSNGAGPSDEGASSSSGATTTTSPKDVKPVSDISHLVRKKRKPEEGEEDEPAGSPCKKVLTEKSA